MPAHRYRRIITLIAATLILASCNSDNIDQRPSSKTITDSSSIIIKEVQKVTAYYNAAGYIVKQTTHSWNDNQPGWSFAHSYINCYNNKGQLIAKETLMPDAFDYAKITPLERDSFEYTPHGDTASLVRHIYSAASDRWVRVSRWEYLYQGHHKTAETALSWDIGSNRYHTVYQRTYEYNNRGDIEKFKTITPHREDTANKHIDICEILYDENGFETSRNVTVVAE